ncbi:hypothetical protein IC757_03235 [Wenzhouxiangella sp. AB-CW3]|uniref:hypothetical protein n=1 Tax=Wenzhouxiangella sp. AB-CW3 TaxID=2771012 RepID=UPI00168B34CD|nr:hypothetical protein [Wenzhouxiangella sp. AB-CW3]QOC23185.1 hypothetical protein IC757_03235 [Wenzhouxiangella sp. AB-CW3]
MLQKKIHEVRVNLLTTFALVLVMCAGLAQAEEHIIWVGGGSGCDTDSLSQALSDAGNGDEVRVLNDRTYNDAPYTISNSIRLLGGYDECGSDTIGGNSDLRGNFNQRVLEVFNPNPSASLDVEIARIDVAQGSTSASGAGLAIGSNHAVVLSDSQFVFNSSESNGGAIRVGSGSTLELTGENEIVLNNADEDGGGIACLESEVTIEHGTAIYNNGAEYGGGIHADDCEVRLYSGGTGNLGVRNNTADERGGGIRAINDAVLVLDGSDSDRSDPSLPVTIRGNGADLFGGGISLTDGAEAALINTVIENNVTEALAAAFDVGLRSSLTMEPDMDVSCQNPGASNLSSCSIIHGNAAEDEGRGGYVVTGGFGSSTEIRQTKILGNSVAGHGGIIQAQNGANMLIENALIADNETGDSNLTTNVIRISGGPPHTGITEVVIRFSTLANHQGGLSDDTLIDMFSGDDREARLGLEGLVIDQPGTTVVRDRGDGVNELNRAACIVAPETDSMEALATSTALVVQLLDQDPLLVDPQAGNYRLSAGSPAVDVCAMLPVGSPHPLIPPQTDLDGHNRGVANSDEGESTPFDVGAFERLGEQVFQDRFENG